VAGRLAERAFAWLKALLRRGCVQRLRIRNGVGGACGTNRTGSMGAVALNPSRRAAQDRLAMKSK
jgi:hypothetical protein